MSAAATARIVIAVTTAVLLTGMGGEAIVAAPVLVPALWWAARSTRRWARAGIVFLAALVMAEVGWFLTYIWLHRGEEQPWIVLGPSVAFLSTVAVFFRTLGPPPRRARNTGAATGGAPVQGR